MRCLVCVNHSYAGPHPRSTWSILPNVVRQFSDTYGAFYTIPWEHLVEYLETRYVPRFYECTVLARARTLYLTEANGNFAKVIHGRMRVLTALPGYMFVNPEEQRMFLLAGFEGPTLDRILRDLPQHQPLAERS